MALLHLRVVAPADLREKILDLLHDQPGATNVIAMPGVVREPVADLVEADLARECTQDVVSRLRELGVDHRGSISWESLETALGDDLRRAEQAAPGEGADAIIWEQVLADTGEDSTLTGTFLAFMVLACLLAAIGVATDSPITIVGAMVVGPEFGPLAGVAVGLRLGLRDAVRRGLLALVVGFATAIAVTAAVAVAWRASGLVHVGDLVTSTQTEFIYRPGWFSLITALVAGVAGTLSLTSSKPTALVGVFISVTTIPAAGNLALALVFGRFGDAGGAALQLLVNLTGILAAACLTLLARGRPRRRPVPEPMAGG